MMFRGERRVYSRSDEQKKTTEAGRMKVDREQKLWNELFNPFTAMTDRG